MEHRHPGLDPDPGGGVARIRSLIASSWPPGGISTTVSSYD